jgi:hypothetical protein
MTVRPRIPTGLADDLGSVDDEDANSLPDTLYVSLQRPEIRLPALIDHVVRAGGC